MTRAKVIVFASDSLISAGPDVIVGAARADLAGAFSTIDNVDAMAMVGLRVSRRDSGSLLDPARAQ